MHFLCFLVLKLVPVPFRSYVHAKIELLFLKDIQAITKQENFDSQNRRSSGSVSILTTTPIHSFFIFWIIVDHIAKHFHNFFLHKTSWMSSIWNIPGFAISQLP